MEVGCGPGPNIWYLVREGYQVAGIDGSATAIRQARERLAAEGLPSATEAVDLRVGNFVELPWPDGAFDAVVDIAALYANSVVDIRHAIGEIHRTLKADGLFFGKMFGVVTTGSDSGEAVEPGTRRRPDRGPCAGNELAHFFSGPELQELFRDFSSITLDSMLRTEHVGETRIFHWLVTAKK
jgi:SAM-dependent methyltransferase